MKTLLTMTALAAIATGCRSTAPASAAQPQEQPAEPPLTLQQQPRPLDGPADTPIRHALPRAVIYKTNGDYRDNVPVTLNAAGTALVSFPAPSDLTDLSTPLPLADGYLLDRRGVSENSRFTRYTYARYRALPAPPAPATLIDSIIPGARVTVLHRLDITLQQALGDTAAVNDLIRRSYRQADGTQM